MHAPPQRQFLSRDGISACKGLGQAGMPLLISSLATRLPKCTFPYILRLISENACDTLRARNHFVTSGTCQCDERDRLLRNIEQAMKGVVDTQEPDKPNVALDAWKSAREEYKRHIEEHGC
jgi:hypothetical protein